MVEDLQSCEKPSHARYGAGCRCAACCEAHRVYSRARRKHNAFVAQGAALTTMVDALPVQRKILSLIEQGLSQTEIARLSGLSRSTIGALARGSYRDGKPVKHVHRTTKDAIFSIKSRRHLAAYSRVDAVFLVEHVREWHEVLTANEIADMLGVCETVVNNLLRGCEKVAAKTFYAYATSKDHINKVAKQRRAESPYTRKIVCYETGEVFRNAAAVAESIDEIKSQVVRAVEGRFRVGGYHWYWAGEVKPQPNYFKRPNRRAVECVETGEVFESAAEASRAIGREDRAVASSISKKHTAGGYHWRYID